MSLVLFVAFFVPAALWSVSTPLWASPDENFHTLKAWSVAHGQLYVTPDDASSGTGGFLEVPRGLADSASTWSCIAFRPSATGSCVVPPVETEDTIVVANAAARYNPAYYFVVGLPSLVVGVEHAPLAMRVASAALFALFAAWAVSALARSPRPAVAVGVGLLAFTPMSFFLGAVVNPNGLEIAASSALWANLAVLVHRNGGLSDRAVETLTRRSAIAASAMVVTRGLSPVWLVVIVGCCLLVADRSSLRRLLRRHTVVWAGVAGSASLASVIWILASGSLRAGSVGQPVPHWLLDRLSIVRESQSEKWRMAVGNFGWLDAPLPETLTTAWAAAVALVVVLALVRAGPGPRTALVLLAVACYVLPILIEAQSLNVTGLIWQGRYTLPLYVGLPIVSAVVLGRASSRLRTEVAVAAIAAAGLALSVNAFSFLFALHRNIDGLLTVDGVTTPLTLTGDWQPRLGGWGSVVALTGWLGALGLLLVIATWRQARAEAEGSGVERTAAGPPDADAAPPTHPR